MVMSEHVQQILYSTYSLYASGMRICVFATYLLFRFSTKNLLHNLRSPPEVHRDGLVVARPRATAPVPQSGEVLLPRETVPSPLGTKVCDPCEPCVLCHELDMDGQKILLALFRAVCSLKPFCGVYWSSRVLSTGREQPRLNLNTALRRAVLSKLSVGGLPWLLQALPFLVSGLVQLGGPSDPGWRGEAFLQLRPTSYFPEGTCSVVTW